MNVRLTLLLLALLTVPVAPALADGNVSQAEAIKLAKRQYSGRVLKVDETRATYKIKVLKKDGQVITVLVDKQSGRVSGPKSKD